MGRLIKLGVLGVANIAERSLIPAIKNLSSFFELSGIASRNISKAKAAANFFDTKAYNGYESILLEKEIEAIYIPLPNALHAEWIESALLNGKHVLVEKSLACSLKEVEYITKIAQEKGLVLLENFQFRFHPQLQLILEIINNQEIGELRCLRSSFGFPPFTISENIRYKKKLGGGALLDAGAYTTKISQIILGEGLIVKAASLNTQIDGEVDIWGGAYLQNTVNGAFSEIAFGFDHFYQCGIEVWGSKGKLTTNRLFTAPPGFEPVIIIETNSEKKIVKAKKANHFEKILLHFHGLISNQKGIEIEYKQNIDQARLLNEIKEHSHVK